MDLRKSYPRSVHERLGGYVHLGRMIDKARAKHAGTLGEYIYPCPLDQRLLDFLEISGDRFFDAVQSRNDAQMVEWVTAAGKERSAEEIERWNQALVSRAPDTEEKWKYFRGVRDKIDASRTDITTWADLLDLEEGRPIPRRAAAAR